MSRIDNGQQLNKYYESIESEKDIKKSQKTRLIVVTDKSGKHLEARKLSLFERIGALFGGKASLKTVAEFCTQNGLNSEGFSKLVTKYNEAHPKSRLFYAHFSGGKKIATQMSPLNQRAYLTKALQYAKHDNFKQLEALFKSHPELLKDPIVSATLQAELRTAVQEGNTTKTDVLLRYVTTTGLLHTACSNGDLAMVKALHKAGIDLDAPDETRMTPLMYAAGQGHDEVVEFLLSKEVNPNVKTSFGGALQQACQGGHAKVVSLLLNNPKLDLKGVGPSILQNALEVLNRQYEGINTDRLKAISIILLPHLSDLNTKYLREITENFEKEDFAEAVAVFNAECERLQAGGADQMTIAKLAYKANMLVNIAPNRDELQLNPILLPRKL